MNEQWKWDLVITIIIIAYSDLLNKYWSLILNESQKLFISNSIQQKYVKLLFGRRMKLGGRDTNMKKAVSTCRACLV